MKVENINIFDTYSVGTILRYVAKQTVEMDSKGKGFDDISNFINWLKHNHRTYFMVENIDSLKRSNILGPFARFFGLGRRFE